MVVVDALRGIAARASLWRPGDLDHGIGALCRGVCGGRHFQVAISAMDAIRDAIAATTGDSTVLAWEQTPGRTQKDLVELMRQAETYVRRPTNVQIKRGGRRK